ncbi:hypothetical protein lerEdw1_010843 [Lerista edwardsae]|nr:hypothetical protein lerEdw1_010843 [Lerista edwardsae]
MAETRWAPLGLSQQPGSSETLRFGGRRSWRRSSPPCTSLVPLSTMHQDYRWEGSLSAPPGPHPGESGLRGWPAGGGGPVPPGAEPHDEQSRIGIFRFLQPHDYRLEQPQTFWREYAQQVPGVSRDRTGDASFRKCALFTTPVSEYLDLPWPYNPESLAK